MSDQTTGKAFESYLEETLINKSGWKQGSNKDWDKQLALFRSEVVAFIKETQPALWLDMEALRGEELFKVIQILTFFTSDRELLHGEELPNKLIATKVDVRGGISS